ncbi:AAA family ATPase CDC6 [Spizellomyces punctatus DAOM BR117]|uniref:Cell division control protein n=1 Tax=Spizellomyces punctatus (strain DAOM BR117) TaxID=645134 RepID=A0A0L0HJU6_SPIPD|nr:AAA family ATPase CDC6 [Spizellomyces punctatus DAOM BR117]KND01736.1 hypothetical protein SPPG_03529 [Spizellomyces punctatus DAOM BR117]|eukprot:XP_016609775.1 hypothetical protein SPPG_03529 [Spizellomyces punctatus DAOM BR117]
MVTPTRKRSRNAIEAEEENLCEAGTPKRTLRSRTALGSASGNVEIVIPPSPKPGRKPLSRTAPSTPSRTGKKEVLNQNAIAESRSNKASTPSKSARSTPLKQLSPQTPSSRWSKRPNCTPGTPRTPTMVYQDAKALFRRCNTPSRLVGRETERRTIQTFWEDHVIKGNPGSLYISGCPGTGKTALLEEIVNRMEERVDEARHALRIVKLNCMSVKDPKMIYPKLLAEIRGEQTKAKDAVKFLESIFIPEASKGSSRTFFVVIMDEIDSLITKDQEILYKLFEWPALPGSRLVLIGIANALDLTERFLPRLKAKNCQPQLLNFNPYEIKDITEIIKQRLKCLEDVDDETLRENMPSPFKSAISAAKGNAPLMHPMAIELCARKMAGTGDLRKALDVCRHAIELVEAETRRKVLADSLPTAAPPSPSPRRAPGAGSMLLPNSGIGLSSPIDSLDALPKVTVKHILSATNMVFGSPNVNRVKSLSLQLKMVLCTLAVMARQKKGDMSLIKLHETYVQLCKNRRTQLIPVTKTELQDLVTNLETAGLITMVTKRGGGKRDGFGGTLGEKRTSQNVELCVRPEEIESAVADLPILVNLLRLDGAAKV